MASLSRRGVAMLNSRRGSEFPVSRQLTMGSPRISGAGEQASVAGATGLEVVAWDRGASAPQREARAQAVATRREEAFIDRLFTPSDRCTAARCWLSQRTGWIV